MSTQNVNVARCARNVEWDFFCDFQRPCTCQHNVGKQKPNLYFSFQVFFKDKQKCCQAVKLFTIFSVGKKILRFLTCNATALFSLLVCVISFFTTEAFFFLLPICDLFRHNFVLESESLPNMITVFENHWKSLILLIGALK